MLYLKKKLTYILFFILIIIMVILLSFYIYNKRNNQNINIEYIEEKENNEELAKKAEEKQEQEYLIQKYSDKKLLALTFDDGPSKYTNGLVDELKKRDVPATFFLLGENAEKFSQTVAFEVDAGNEVGIHSIKHSLFTKLSNNKINEQILLTKYIIFNVADINITLIRVPYGALNDRVKEVLKENNLTSVLWTVDSKDWKFRNVDKIYNYVLKNIKGNDIILMHDIYSTSVKSAILLVDKLEADGYTFVTVSKFLEIQQMCEKSSQKN